MAGVSSDPPPTVDVLVVDDDPVVRFGLTMMLRGAPDLRVVAEAGDGAEAVELAARHAPDVVLMDIRMPGTDGLTATETLRAPPAGAAGRRAHHVRRRRARPARPARGGGRVPAQGHPARRARRRDPAGGAGTPGALARGHPPAHRPRRRSPNRTPAGTRPAVASALLAERERAIALEIGAGRSNAEIAARHHLSLATVKTHVSAILTKLDLNNRVQVALLVHDAGLDPPA